jgi:hypothetical protein
MPADVGSQIRSQPGSPQGTLSEATAILILHIMVLCRYPFLGSFAHCSTKMPRRPFQTLHSFTISSFSLNLFDFSLTLLIHAASSLLLFPSFSYYALCSNNGLAALAVQYKPMLPRGTGAFRIPSEQCKEQNKQKSKKP